MTPAQRFLFWDYPRGSRAYDLMCLLLVLVLVFMPAGWWADPMVPR